MFETRDDLPLATRTQAVRLLNAPLADAIDLGTQTKHAHWNVKGPNFIALHELFDQLAGHVEEHIDTLAERATALGGADLFTGMSRAVDKDLWFLEAHLHAKR